MVRLGHKCGCVAVNGSPYCYGHGGWRAIPPKRLEENRKRKKLRHANWTIQTSQRRDLAAEPGCTGQSYIQGKDM